MIRREILIDLTESHHSLLNIRRSSDRNQLPSRLSVDGHELLPNHVLMLVTPYLFH